MTTKTISRSYGSHAVVAAADGASGVPCVRLLYHVDLERIRALSMFALPARADWCTIGRLAPLFVGHRGRARPLDDPFISRQQVQVRWLPEVAAFEVAPCPEAKRRVTVLDRRGEEGAVELEIGDGVRVAPGTCVIIGDRAILGLDVVRAHDAEGETSPLLGECDSIVALREQIRRLASFQRSVLLLGPTGAGKELVARALHDHSPRAAAPFVTANCAAMPEPLVESVLFGHRRGAFTGADADQVGLIETADGGTLFLDEVGELPRAIQPKFLRVLEDGIVVPVGAQAGRRANVRVVAATNRDPQEEIAAGRWREDLYHRLAGHVLRVPRLCDRRFDIPGLFTHFLDQVQRQHGELSWMWSATSDWRPTIPLRFFLTLMRGEWSGNVRELQNCAERVAFANPRPGEFHVPDESVRVARACVGAEPPPPSAIASSAPRQDSVLTAAADCLGVAPKTLARLLPAQSIAVLWAEVQAPPWSAAERRQHLRRRAADALYELLTRLDFNQTRLATQLGMSRTTLITLMRDLGLPRAVDLQREAIEAVQAAAGGDIEATARSLRVSPRALRQRLTQLKIDA